MEPERQSASDRYQTQAEAVMRLADKADSPTEREVYLSIAEGWRKLALEALRDERQDLPKTGNEQRSFRHES